MSQNLSLIVPCVITLTSVIIIILYVEFDRACQMDLENFFFIHFTGTSSLLFVSHILYLVSTYFISLIKLPRNLALFSSAAEISARESSISTLV